MLLVVLFNGGFPNISFNLEFAFISLTICFIAFLFKALVFDTILFSNLEV